MELPDPMTNKSAARAWARAQSRAAGPGELMDWGRSFEQLLAIMREHVGKSTDPVVMVYVPIIGEPDPIMLLSSSISMGWRAAVGRDHAEVPGVSGEATAGPAKSAPVSASP